MRSSHCLLLLAPWAVAACGGTWKEFTPTNEPPYELLPRPADSVEIFTAGPPDRPYIELGMVSVQQADEFTQGGRERLLRDLRKVAGSHGCDAVVIRERTAEVAPDRFAPDVTHTNEGFWGTCILYPDSTYRPGQAPQPQPATPPKDPNLG